MQCQCRQHRASQRVRRWATPAGMVALAGACPRAPDGALCAALVPFGMTSGHVLANVDGELLMLDTAQALRAPTGVCSRPCGTLTWSSEAVAARLGRNGEEARLFSAAIHAAAIVGALHRLFGMALHYCNDRSQFGKSIGKFLALQHQLSVMAQHVASADIAAEIAFSDACHVRERLAAAVAKARTGMAVPLVATAAHALHGAIGVTEDYGLQLFTRRPRERRAADGAETFWNRMVREALLARAQTSVADFARTTLHAVTA